MAEIQALVENGTINDKLARQVFEGVIAGEGSSAEAVTTRKLAIVSDEGALAAAVNEAINANPDIVDKIKSGKLQATGALIGSVMQQMRGQADATRIREMILEKIANQELSGRLGVHGEEEESRQKYEVDCALLPGCRPGTTVRIPTTTVTASNTIWVASSPNTSGPSSQIEAMAIAGMVSPMLAMAEPNARLRLVWIRSRRAAAAAASVSGSRTSKAITTPTNDGGNPTAETPAAIAGVSTLARPTTATESQHQEADAGQRRSVAGWIGVFFGLHDVAGRCQRKEEVSVPTRLCQDEHCVQGERGDGRKGQLRRSELRTGATEG